MSRDVGLLILTLLLGSAARIPQLSHSLFEAHAFRQTQTAFAIREYARNGVNLLSTPLPVFGKGSEAPFEFPLMQGFAALLTHLGLTPEAAGRTVGLMGFQASVALTWVLARRWFGAEAALLSALLLQLLPYGLAWGASSLIDFGSVALALGMVASLDAYAHRGRPAALVAGLGLAWLCGLVKLTSLIPWSAALAVAMLALPRGRHLVRRGCTALLLGPVGGFAIASLWTRYADSVKDSNPATRFITSGALTDWNFGTLDQRLSTSGYASVAHHALLEVGGPAGLLLAAALFGAVSRIGLAWHRIAHLCALVTGPAILFNLYAVHAYYWIAVFPAAAILGALGIVELATRMSTSERARPRTALLLSGLVIVAAMAIPAGPSEVDQFVTSKDAPPLSIRLAARTAPQDPVIVVGCDWDPTVLYAADRQGFMVRDTTPEALPPVESMKQYRLLVLCDPAVDPDKYLPRGWRALPTDDSAFFALVRVTSRS